MPNPRAIDPPGCGCTECLIGEYVPLDRATNTQIRQMTAGEIADHTGGDWETVTITHFNFHNQILRQWVAGFVV
jgi:hypothetical protein